MPGQAGRLMGPAGRGCRLVVNVLRGVVFVSLVIVAFVVFSMVMALLIKIAFVVVCLAAAYYLIMRVGRPRRPRGSDRWWR